MPGYEPLITLKEAGTLQDQSLGRCYIRFYNGVITLKMWTLFYLRSKLTPQEADKGGESGTFSFAILNFDLRYAPSRLMGGDRHNTSTAPRLRVIKLN